MCDLRRMDRGSSPCFMRRVVRNGMSKLLPFQVTRISKLSKRFDRLDNNAFSSLVLLASKYSPHPASDMSPAPTSTPASPSRDVVSMSRITILAAIVCRLLVQSLSALGALSKG